MWKQAAFDILSRHGTFSLRRKSLQLISSFPNFLPYIYNRTFPPFAKLKSTVPDPCSRCILPLLICLTNLSSIWRFPVPRQGLSEPVTISAPHMDTLAYKCTSLPSSRLHWSNRWLSVVSLQKCLPAIMPYSLPIANGNTVYKPK